MFHSVFFSLSFRNTFCGDLSVSILVFSTELMSRVDDTTRRRWEMLRIVQSFLAARRKKRLFSLPTLARVEQKTHIYNFENRNENWGRKLISQQTCSSCQMFSTMCNWFSCCFSHPSTLLPPPSMPHRSTQQSKQAILALKISWKGNCIGN